MKFINNLKSKPYYLALLQFSFIIATTFLFLADDYLFKIFNPANKAKFFTKYTLLCFGLSVILSFIKSKKLIYTVLGIFCFLDLTNLCYLAYFGVYLHPATIPLIFTEIPEILLAGFGEFNRSYYAIISVVLPYFILFRLYKKYNEKLYKIKYFWLALILVMLYFPRRSYRTANISTLLPNGTNPALYNSLKVYNGYLFNILLKQNKHKDVKFEPYTYTKHNSKDINVIFIMGESFNVMNEQIFGYERETQPLLTEMLKTDKSLYWTKGIAGGTTTHTSLPNFYNLQREPLNYNKQMQQDTNLFKLAKENGFKTYYLSVQNSGMTVNIGTQWIDHLVTFQDEEKLFSSIRDEGILEILKRYDFSEGKNFIVIHQRNMHAPQWLNYDYRKQEFERWVEGERRDTYDNSMLYNDWLIYNYIQQIKKQSSDIPYYILGTSDHGDNTGQDNYWGHGQFFEGVYYVPVYLYTNDETYMENFKQIYLPTHYEIAKELAKLLGYEITNPNEKQDIFYVNGTDLMGRHGFVEVTKDSENKKVEFKVIE
ncbi:MAG: sulfatase-like hydrolase/transferase [Rickettsiales bacterium]|jgi:glucan phosphoethanolaminetransferase (alkaline phosphatase superfamily)|nr:sulfatase-like hydrolase/transferase [Rickettsiales bacterium]